jgi:hypothetical protein
MKRKKSTYIQPLCEVYKLLNEMDLLAASDGKNKLRIDNKKEITDEKDIL